MTREERRIKGLKFSIEMWEYMLETGSSKKQSSIYIFNKYNIPIEDLQFSFYCPLCWYVGKYNCGSCIDWGGSGWNKHPCIDNGSPYKSWEYKKDKINTINMIKYLKEAYELEKESMEISVSS